MKRWTALTIAFTIIFILAGCAKQDWVAKVGNTIIYEDAVTERMIRGISREDAVKDLIEEAIMYNDALEKGYVELVQDELNNASNQLLVRNLYKIAVLDRIKIHPYTIKNRWNKMQKEVRARKISVSDMDNAKQIYRRLVIGDNFVELAREKSEDRSTASTGGDLGWVDYRAEIEPDLLEPILSLGKGKFSSPFESRGNWFIVMAEDIRFKEGTLTREEMDRIEQELKREEERRIAMEFLEHMKGLADIKFDDMVVKDISQSIDRSGLPDISALDPKSIVLKSGAKNINIEEFIKIVETRRRPPFDNPETIKTFLANYLVYEILLPIEAKRHRIHTAPEIKKDIEKRRMSVVLRKYNQNEIEKIVPEPTDSEIESYYKDNIVKYRDIARAKVKIIECKTEEEAKEARERLMKGEEFAQVAKEVSIHQSSARGGSLGWIRKEQHKELDQKVFTTTLNKITTPFHISLGWCILIVEDRKKERTKPLDEVRRQVISELKTQARQKIKDQLIEQLKEKFTVDIKEHKVEIPVT